MFQRAVLLKFAMVSTDNDLGSGAPGSPWNFTILYLHFGYQNVKKPTIF